MCKLLLRLCVNNARISRGLETGPFGCIVHTTARLSACSVYIKQISMRNDLAFWVGDQDCVGSP